MKTVTLTVVAVLLAVPALAQAKAGIEFNQAIEQQHPGDSQSFTAIVMKDPPNREGGEPTPIVGVHALVSFTNQDTGRVIRVRTSATDSEGIASGRVTFPDRGPWGISMSLGGKPFGGPELGDFEVGSALQARLPQTAARQTTAHDGSQPSGWLLLFPAAALIALGVWLTRRRPRELGT